MTTSLLSVNNQLNAIAQVAADLKAEDILAFNVSERLPLADAFLLLTGTSHRHVGSIVDEIEKAMIENYEMRPLRREGKNDGKWVLLDYGDVVVHVQSPEDRQYYGLENLWADSPRYQLDID